VSGLVATLDAANRAYGRPLATAAAVAAVLVWLANRPVRPRPLVTSARAPVDWAGWRWRLRRLVWLPGGGQAPPAPPAPPWRQAALDAAPARGSLLGRGGRPALMPPGRAHSALYDAYVKGGQPSPYTGRTWAQTKAVLWPEHRRRFGPGCQLGLVCGGLAAASELDHCAKAAGWPHDYSRLGMESVHDTAGVCHDCHVRRTSLQRQHVNAWLLPQALRKFPRRTP
jgi:hypothetical protein